MPSEEFFRSVQAIMKMPAEDLPYLYGVLTEAMRTQGLPVTTKGEMINTGLLVQQAMKLLNSKIELTGWEMALLAGVILQFGDFAGNGQMDVTFDSRSITGELRRYPERNISNITSVTDSLRERNFIEDAEAAREKGAHRSFKVTIRGQNEVLKLWDRHEKSLAA